MRTLKAPARVIWEITQQCNLQCRHCSLSANSSKHGELSTQEAMSMARYLCDIHVFQVALSGGEPLLRPDCLAIARVLSKGGISVGLNTNGFLINEKIAEEIKHAGIMCVTISLDGAKAETHDEFRGQEGAWDQVIQALQYLISSGQDVTATCVLHRYNMEEALDLIMLLKEMGVGGIKFMRLHPVGKARTIYDHYLMPFENTTALINTLLEEKKKLGMDFNIMLGDNFANEFLDQRKVDRFETGMCEAGRYKCVISADGTIRPCEFFIGEEFHAGNIKNKSLQDIWQTSEVFHYLRSDHLYQSCMICEKVCPGRCPACAIYLGSIQGPDPTCPIMLYSHQNNKKG